MGSTGAFARGLADLSQALSAAVGLADLRSANRLASELLRADEVALMRVDAAADELALVTDHADYPSGTTWPLAEFPATRYVIEHGIPGQVVAGDPGADRAELGELEYIGMATMLIVPVQLGDRTLGVLEVYRGVPRRSPRAEIDRAQVVAHQFAAALRPPQRQ